MKKTFINLFNRILNVFEEAGMRRAQAELRRHYYYNKTFQDLNRLSDRELKDIGVSRSNIHSIALENYYDNTKV
jgi:uncharacterized protein YjiS (DUF1127 family)